MNPRPNPSPPDAADAPGHTALRSALRQSLLQAQPADTQALQDRVLAQWQQRHPASDAALATAGSALLAHRASSRWAVASLVLAMALTASWLNQPDPLLEELLQPDVLSQIGMGEF